MSYNENEVIIVEVFEAIEKRFSNRKFLDKQINNEDLNKILKAGMQAPVGRGRYDDMHITVIQDKSLLNEIGTLIDRNVFYNAPTLVIISSKDDGHGLDKENSACIAMNMLLAATSLGLGNIYLNLVIGLIKEHKDVLDKLNLPEGFVPVVGVGLGYADGTHIREHEINVDYM